MRRVPDLQPVTNPGMIARRWFLKQCGVGLGQLIVEAVNLDGQIVHRVLRPARTTIPTRFSTISKYRMRGGPFSMA